MRRTVAIAVASTALGLAGCAAGLAVDPTRALVSWLVAFTFLLTTCLGCFALVMIAHAARARWIVPLRRFAEVPMALLPAFAVLILPVLIGAGRIYPWVSGVPFMPPEEQHAVAAKHAWLNVPFFVVRSYLYLAVWSAFALALALQSVRQDERGDGARQVRMQRSSAAGLPVLALTLTFASFDWLMSLQPEWLSSVFGLYVGAGALVAGVAVMALAASIGAGRGLVRGEIGPPHLHAAGKLLFALVCFWAWMAFAQLIVIWSGNVPREVEFFRLRSEQGWGWFSAVLVGVHFAVPFLVLLSREVKLRPLGLGSMAAWLLAAHYVDVYWLVMPTLAHHFQAHWLDLATLLLCGGLLVLAGALVVRWGGVSALATGDAYFAESLGYRGS